MWNENSWLLPLLLPMTLCGALGAAGLKLYADGRCLRHLLLGFGFYGLGALLNIALLRVLPLTVVLPANALTYVWTLLLARFYFGEKVGPLRWFGILFILGGLALLVACLT
ncbi:EamA family transporter [Saccharibacillus sp. CPCC 101409]|uniref:EamA family transporter n=1 Tax=Saccharibacillus sp. CPCC 101409 TaxID=3058041 RepID=UPI0026735943|nr:EamA family transporter [Saccharibacillus sp. CPCC 101409]MDO3411180.1 EamA family transporter [Saccharibacillus sp. CPCC 101409]